jgi:hypothetical protein
MIHAGHGVRVRWAGLLRGLKGGGVQNAELRCG